MTERERLSAIKVDELRKMATAAGIKKSKTYKKAELVDMLVEIGESKNGKITETDTPIVTEQSGEETIKIDREGKMKRIERVDIGTIVAFETEDGKVKSAKVINKSSKNRKLKLETIYGREYIVSYDKVVWVRTGARWPRGVYNLLKGNKNGQETNKVAAEAK